MDLSLTLTEVWYKNPMFTYFNAPSVFPHDHAFLEFLQVYAMEINRE